MVPSGEASAWIVSPLAKPARNLHTHEKTYTRWQDRDIRYATRLPQFHFLPDQVLVTGFDTKPLNPHLMGFAMALTTTQ